MTYIITHTGRRFYPGDPQPSQILVGDIAHALAMTCRWGGHTKYHYSVAQHSILVSWALEREHPADLDAAMWGLFHDAAEAYITDIPKPIKHGFDCGELITIEDRILELIRLRFDLPAMPERVKEADCQILVDECEQVMGVDPESIELPWPGTGLAINRMTPEQAKESFLKRYLYLKDRRLPDLETLNKVKRGEQRLCTINQKPAVTWWPK